MYDRSLGHSIEFDSFHAQRPVVKLSVHLPQGLVSWLEALARTGFVGEFA